MRVLWYNTYCLPYITTNSHINKIATYLYKHVVNTDPDIIGLCEVFHENTKKKFLEYFTAYTVDYVYGVYDSGSWWGKQSSGLICLYKKTITNIQDIEFKSFSCCWLQDCLANKGYISIDIDDIKLIFSHFQDPDAGLLSSVEDINKSQIQTIVNSIDCSSILIGDFNIEADVMETWLGKHMSIISPILPTCGNKVIDYAICTNNLSHKISSQVLFADNNPSDHDIILVEIDNKEQYTNTGTIQSKSSATRLRSGLRDWYKSWPIRIFIYIILSLLVYKLIFPKKLFQK